MKAKNWIITLMGYTNPGHTNWYPWKKFYEVFNELGYETEWVELENLEVKKDKRRIFICWNEPTSLELIHSGKYQEHDILLQKLTSLGKGCDDINWGDNPYEFFKNWHWPLYRMFERIYDSGYNIFAFGCKTDPEPFPEKKRICDKLKDRIFWIPWGSSLYSWEEIQRAKPIMDNFEFDIGFVGSIWGIKGRGNIDTVEDFLLPIIKNKKCALGGQGTPLGPVDDKTHKYILKKSKLCPIINAPSWRIEKGVQDRFWTVFTSGRFGVVDSEGIYYFFNEDEVVCETHPEEYIEKSIYFLNNVEKQKPYIEKVLKRIKKEYNYYITWERILAKIIPENKYSIDNLQKLDRIETFHINTIHGHTLLLINKNKIKKIAKEVETPVIVEIGSQRDAGSTLELAKMCNEFGIKFITVDPDENVYLSAKKIIKEINPEFEAVCKEGELFLQEWNKKNIIAVYLDAFDIVTYWPHKNKTIESYRKRKTELTNENAYKMHLEAAKNVYEKIVDNGFICFDDTWLDEYNQWEGKGKTAVPFLLNNGFVISDYKPCAVLMKKIKKIKYMFVPSNDTHVNWMLPIYNKLDSAIFLVHPIEKENARYYLYKNRVKYYTFKPGIFNEIRPEVLIFGNDWGPLEKQIITEAKKYNIKTVCIQEGPLFFEEISMNRMKNCDFALIQGPIMKKYLNRNNIIITGNPKYDFIKEEPLPDKPVVMINSNFTYGVYEDVRDSWVNDAVLACVDCKIDYFISKHPRDRGNFPDYNVIDSDAFKIKDQLKMCSILITRFSTLIYEALYMGREVIYYNPHGEPFKIFNEDDSGAIFKAKNRKELIEAINNIISGEKPNKEIILKFLNNHCIGIDKKNTERCIKALEEIYNG